MLQSVRWVGGSYRYDALPSAGCSYCCCAVCAGYGLPCADCGLPSADNCQSVPNPSQTNTGPCPTVESLMSHSLHTARGCVWDVSHPLRTAMLVQTRTCTGTPATTAQMSASLPLVVNLVMPNSSHTTMLLAHILRLVVHPLCDPCRCTSELLFMVVAALA